MQDVIGDLAFGEPFGCLSESNYHPWVATIFQSVKQGLQLNVLSRSFPRVSRFIQSRLMGRLAPNRKHHVDLTCAKVAKRMAMEEDRPDFMHAMLGKHEGGKEVSLESAGTDRGDDIVRLIMTPVSETVIGTDLGKRVLADHSRLRDDGDRTVWRHLPPL